MEVFDVKLFLLRLNTVLVQANVQVTLVKQAVPVIHYRIYQAQQDVGALYFEIRGVEVHVTYYPESNVSEGFVKTFREYIERALAE